jgi:hypothetical protein
LKNPPPGHLLKNTYLKYQFLFCRCWYPRTGREVGDHLRVPALWRLPRTTTWASGKGPCTRNTIFGRTTTLRDKN